MANPTRTAQIRIEADKQVADMKIDCDRRIEEAFATIEEAIENGISAANAERDLIRAQMDDLAGEISELADKALAMDRANDQLFKFFKRLRSKAQRALWEDAPGAAARFVQWVHGAAQSERDRINKQMRDYRPITRPTASTLSVGDVITTDDGEDYTVEGPIGVLGEEIDDV